MTRPDQHELQAGSVQDLGRLQDFPPFAADVAVRIADGAASAVAAVVAARRGSLFDTEPGFFLAELERLADDHQ